MTILDDMKQLQNRTDIPHFLKKYRLNRTIVEIGVFHGLHIESLLSCDPDLYVGIDMWDATTGDYEAPQQSHTNQYLQVAHRYLRVPNVKLIRASSADASHLFLPASLDFVYIDGMHTYEAVTRDLVHWHGLVRDGGILAGHDYFTPNFPYRHGTVGVIQAIDEYRHHKNIPDDYFHVTPGGTKTWMIYSQGGS